MFISTADEDKENKSLKKRNERTTTWLENKGNDT